MYQQKVKLLRNDIIQFSKSGCWAHMKMFVNDFGTRWEEIELSMERPLELETQEGKSW